MSPFLNFISFFTPILLKKIHSKQSGQLRLYVSNGRLLLKTPCVTYSYSDLYTPFIQVFNAIRIKQLAPKETLVLGFGLGSVVDILEKRFNTTSNFTGIEDDAMVIQLFDDYKKSYQSPIQLVEQDAYSFTETTDKRYDLIIIDLFIDDTIPVKFRNPSFLMSVKRALAPNGVVLFNHLITSKHIQQTEAYYRDLFAPTFNVTDTVSTSVNKILIGYNRK